MGYGYFFMQTGERIKEERERLGFNQSDFAALAGATRKTLFNWESGAASPNAEALAAWAREGLDVLYVVTGQHSQGLPPDQQVLVSAYQRCTAEGKHHLIQTAALLSAGMPVAPAASPKRRAKADSQEPTQHATSGGINQFNTGNNAFQVGSVGYLPRRTR